MSNSNRLQEINQLAQAKTSNKSLSKTPSEAIVNLIEALPEKVYLDNRIYLAALFKAHYKPSKAAKVGIFDVVARFCGKKDIRPYLNFIYSTGSEIVGSNGHVLIAIKVPQDQWPAGFYDPKTHLRRPDMDEYRYPDHYKVIPGDGSLVPIDKTILDTQPSKYSSGKNPVLVYKIGAGYYQARYIDIIPASASDWYQDVASPPALVAKSPDGAMTLVVMPTHCLGR